MPANLTADYLEAERRYRQASTPDEQMAALREMLSTIPKHKGTEKLQADIKRRMSQLRKEGEKKQATARQRPVWVIDFEGAGQIPLLGPPNAGKSALIAALSGAPVEVADYPYTTQQPAPAMMPFENAQVQLVDTPPASEEYAPSWVTEIARRADVVALVADLSDPDGWAGPAWLLERLEEAGIELVPARVVKAANVGAGDGDDSGAEAANVGAGGTVVADGREAANVGADGGANPDTSGDREVPASGPGLAAHIPALVLATKLDAGAADASLEALREYLGGRLPILPASATSGEGLEELRRALFVSLRVIRVYSKEPGEPPDRERPWILPEGSTVLDLARTIHRDLAASFEYGRLWGSARFEGQRVGEDYVLHDEDIVEIHA